MKITLISTIMFELGISTLAPLLKRQGHQVKIFQIPEIADNFEVKHFEKIKNNLNKALGDEELIGITCFSEHYTKVVSLIENIKKDFNTPIIWGGVHAILRPEDCIKYADIVCVGEAEYTLPELAGRMEKGEDISGIKNLLFKKDWNGNTKCEMEELYDLNELPGLDYEFDKQFIIDKDGIRKTTEDDIKGGEIISFSSRSCPYTCTFCCNVALAGMYPGKKFFRQRDLGRVVDELSVVTKKYPKIKAVWFNDADFLSGKNISELEMFRDRYLKEVKLPFSFWANPLAIKEPKIKILKEAGLHGISLGTLSGSKRLQKLINKRKATSGKYIENVKMLLRYNVKVEIDVISRNPFETEEDSVATIRALLEIKKPFRLVIFSMAYYFGTEMYNKAVESGFITNRQYDLNYGMTFYKSLKYETKNAYINIILALLRGEAKVGKFTGITWYGLLPESLLIILISKPARCFFNNMPFERLIYRTLAFFFEVFYNTVRSAKELLERRNVINLD